MNENAYVHGFASLRPVISSSRLRSLINSSPNLERAWEADRKTLQKEGWTNRHISFFLQRRTKWNIENRYKQLVQTGISIIPITNPSFPSLLRYISDPPIALYTRGNLSRGNTLRVAIVGSRKATSYGKNVVRMIVPRIVTHGATIVSGLAYGIDATAHQVTLEVKGNTYAVLGSGIDEMSIYPPEHSQLASTIEHSGCVISEYPPGTSPDAKLFPERNRIIVGLSHVVIVVEAAKRSGALITARIGAEENREVCAIPGPVTSLQSAGTNALLREGATPITNADDILEIIEQAGIFDRIKAVRKNTLY